MGDCNRPHAKIGFAWVLLLAALAMRAVIPQGYMAESTSPGTLAVTVCHSGAVWQIPVEKKQDREQRDPQPCAFAGLSTGAPPGPDAIVLSLPPVAAASFATNEAPLALASAARQLPPARGPPAWS